MTAGTLRHVSAPPAVTAGIALSVLAHALFAFHDATIKWLLASHAVAQILFCRSAVILACCLMLGRAPLLRRALLTPARGPLLFRGFVILAAWLCYYTAARSLPLAELMTLYFAAPVLVTLMAAPLLGERVGPARWGAVGLGFMGVLVALGSPGAGLSWPAGLALLAAALWAYAIVLVRRIALQESSLLQMLYGNGFFLVATGAMLPFAWHRPSLPELGLMLLVGALGGAGQLTLFEGMRRAEASVLATFEYTGLIWAFLLGFLLWGDVPGPPVVVGAMLITASGLAMLLAARRRPA